MLLMWPGSIEEIKTYSVSPLNYFLQSHLDNRKHGIELSILD